MLTEKIWLVKNPTEVSEKGDILMEFTPNQLAQYVIGTGLDKFKEENHAFHTSERTADCDAEGRLRIRDTIVKMLATHNAKVRKAEDGPVNRDDADREYERDPRTGGRR